MVIVWHVCSCLGNVQCAMLPCGRHCYFVCMCVSVSVCVCVFVSQCFGFLWCTFAGLLKCLRTFHFHVVAWSASSHGSPQYRHVMLMEHPDGNATHILLFPYFPAMVRFDKVAIRCILDVPTCTWLARGRSASAVKVLPLCYALKACGGSGGIAPLHDIPMT